MSIEIPPPMFLRFFVRGHPVPTPPTILGPGQLVVAQIKELPVFTNPETGALTPGPGSPRPIHASYRDAGGRLFESTADLLLVQQSDGSQDLALGPLRYQPPPRPPANEVR